MLVQWLSEIQKRQGYLTRNDLTRVALRAGVPLYQVQEFASFFPSYRFEPEGVKPLLKPLLHVCQSMVCHLKWVGAEVPRVRDALEVIKRHPKPTADEPEEVGRVRDVLGQRPEYEIQGVSCLGRCDRAPIAMMYKPDENQSPVYHEQLLVGQFTNDKLTGLKEGSDLIPTNQTGWTLSIAPTQGWAYEAVQYVWAGLQPGTNAANRIERDDVPRRLVEGGLLGLSGVAGWTGNKWIDVNKISDPVRYVVANGDESEPGTFKDREVMLRYPHLVIEGTLIAAIFLKAARAFIYVRHEYFNQIDRLKSELNRIRNDANIGKILAAHPVDIIESPGRYICGEESALLEVLEGHRAQPRNNPPEVTSQGLYGHPTLVNNVETLARIPALLWPWTSPTPANQEVEEIPPRSLYSVSGDVTAPGVYEMDRTKTISDLLEKAGGDPKQIVGVATSGPSRGILPLILKLVLRRDRILDKLKIAKEKKRVQMFLDAASPHYHTLNLPLDAVIFRAIGLALGAGIIFYSSDEKNRMLSHAQNCTEFFRDESCGKCVPCRLGSDQLVHLGIKLAENREVDRVKRTIRDLAATMRDTSICGLGRTASRPLTAYLDFPPTTTQPHQQPREGER